MLAAGDFKEKVKPVVKKNAGPTSVEALMPISFDKKTIILDSEVLELLGGSKETIKTVAEREFDNFRLFGWFANEDVPEALQPLLRWYSGIVTPLVADARDAVFITHMLFFLVTVVPSAIGLMLSFSWPHAICHTVFLGVFIAPFILMLHCMCHRKIASKDHPWVEGVVHWVLSPFMGETWNTFYFHHVKHHHVEDNGFEDLSSTIWYDRDNAFHFAIYFFRFYLLCIIELPIYFIRKRKFKWAAYLLCGEFGTFAMYGFWFWMFPQNTLGVVFAWIVPFNLARFGMMSGNWAQHAFVQPDDPKNDYKTSLTCISTFYNLNCFNDGYHTSHHLNPLRRWDDHPAHFVEQADVYKKQTVVVFKDIDFHGIWVMLMTKDYDGMAKHFVQLGDGDKMSHDEVKAFLKMRTRHLTKQNIDKHYPQKA